MKPELFIGSSVEGLEIAEAIEQNLQHKFNVTIWTNGVFNLSDVTLDNLLEQLQKTDFGIFVFSADDVIKIRKQEQYAVRDNVLYELGLYTGKLGRKSTFVIKPTDTPGDFHLPTDLTGIYLGTYDSRSNKQAAVSSFCGRVKSQIFDNSKYIFNGEWKFMWKVDNSEKYPKPSVEKVAVFHYDGKIKFIHTVEENEKYLISAEFANHCLTGTWKNITGVGYDGVFQMKMSGKANKFGGVWCGWSDGGTINSGPCSLEK